MDTQLSPSFNFLLPNIHFFVKVCLSQFHSLSTFSSSLNALLLIYYNTLSNRSFSQQFTKLYLSQCSQNTLSITLRLFSFQVPSYKKNLPTDFSLHQCGIVLWQETSSFGNLHILFLRQFTSLVSYFRRSSFPTLALSYLSLQSVELRLICCFKAIIKEVVQITFDHHSSTTCVFTS